MLIAFWMFFFPFVFTWQYLRSSLWCKTWFSVAWVGTWEPNSKQPTSKTQVQDPSGKVHHGLLLLFTNPKFSPSTPDFNADNVQCGDSTLGGAWFTFLGTGKPFSFELKTVGTDEHFRSEVSIFQGPCAWVHSNRSWERCQRSSCWYEIAYQWTVKETDFDLEWRSWSRDWS